MASSATRHAATGAHSLRLSPISCLRSPDVKSNATCILLSCGLGRMPTTGSVRLLSTNSRRQLLGPISAWTGKEKLRNSIAISAMAAEQDGKWRATVSDVVAAPIEKVWEILSDFDGLHRQFPKTFTMCETVEGEKNKVGSLRHLNSPLPDGIVVDAKERLLSLDDENHTTTYGMEDNNLGWTGYKGHIVAKSTGNGSTAVDWSFEVNPTANQTKEEYTPLQKGLFQTLLATTKETLGKS